MQVGDPFRDRKPEAGSARERIDLTRMGFIDAEKSLEYQLSLFGRDLGGGVSYLDRLLCDCHLDPPVRLVILDRIVQKIQEQTLQ